MLRHFTTSCRGEQQAVQAAQVVALASSAFARLAWPVFPWRSSEEQVRDAKKSRGRPLSEPVPIVQVAELLQLAVRSQTPGALGMCSC